MQCGMRDHYVMCKVYFIDTLCNAISVLEYQFLEKCIN
jgi:hypothetical protein